MLQFLLTQIGKIKKALAGVTESVSDVNVTNIATDSHGKTFKVTSDEPFPSVVVYGSNGKVIQQVIQIMGSGVQTIYHGETGFDLNPQKIDNKTFTIDVWEYARLQVLSRTPITITEQTEQG